MVQTLTAPIGYGIVCLTLGWSAIRSGLFFDSDLYGFERIVMIAALLWVAYEWIAGRSTIRAGRMIYPLGIAGIYGLTLMMNPVSVQGSVDAALRWVTYCCYGVCLAALWRKERNREWGKAAIQAVGILLLISGWLGWFGIYTPQNIVLMFNDPALSDSGSRLAGYLEYPNTYGALLAAFLLMQLQAWTDGGSKRWQAWAAAVTSIPYGGALLLTESRGSYAALLFGLAIALLLAPANRRLRWTLVIGMTAAGSTAMAMIGRHWMPSEGEPVSAIGAAAALACAGVAGALMLAVRARMQEATGHAGIRNMTMSWAASVAGIAAIAAIVWLWKGTDGERLTGHLETAASRLLFYRDGWRMFLDRPWFGYGGDSWRTMVTAYQSEPYVGNEVHSGYLAMLLDTGIVGLTLLLLLIGMGLRALWKSDRAAVAPAAVLLAHALIDFDWSYAFVWLLLIAWLQAHAPSEPAPAGKARDRGAWARLGRASMAALLAAGAAAGIWAATRSDAAAQAYGEAAAAPSPEARAAHLRAALDANPAYARIRLGLAPLLPLAERASLLAAGLRYEPQSAPLRLQLGIAYAELGDVAQARSSLREALRLDRYSREGHTAALAAMANLAESRREAGDEGAAREAAAAGASFYANYRELARHVAAMDHPANDRQFALTVAAQYHAARCSLILGEREEADQLLREIVRIADGDWREMALKLLDG